MNPKEDKRNYDIASISQPGQEKRANYAQYALYMDKKKISKAGKFVKVFADMFLKKEATNKSYF
ncbi:MAG: hypothetical protein HQ596_07360 [Candidatus Saganbacteria bacterium]|nr:hypothetical protein [Candidatus Saganbacteria bacterium]